jgi:hypothetical protein
MLFDRCDADFELLAFVDLVLFELGELGVELFDAAVEACFGRCEIVFGGHALDDESKHFAEFVDRGFILVPYAGSISPLGIAARVRRWFGWHAARKLEARRTQIYHVRRSDESPLEKRQQFGVDRFGMRGGHAVREVLVGLQRSVLEQLG